MDTTSKGKDKSTNRISKNVKNWLFNLLFLSKLEGVGKKRRGVCGAFTSQMGRKPPWNQRRPLWFS